LRKETSWEGWRDESIDVEEYENEPIEGFVLNRDVGGSQRSWGWNARREKVRVYDPREFEFEISVENLLFILQECSSIKGKGLEGEFVYSWARADIVLLPTCSQEYKSSTEFGELQTKKVTAKDIEAGCTYLTKDREEVMYLGRFPWFDHSDNYYYNRVWTKAKAFGKKQHVFVYLNKKEPSYGAKNGRWRYWLQSGFTKLATKTTDSPVLQFADEYEKLHKTMFISEPLKLFVKGTKINFGSDSYYYSYSDFACIKDNGRYLIGKVSKTRASYDYGYNRREAKPTTYVIEFTTEMSVVNGECVAKRVNDGIHKKNLTLQEVKAVVKDLYVECKNGANYKVGG